MRILGGIVAALVLAEPAAALERPADFVSALYAEKAAAEAEDDHAVVNRIVAAHMTAEIVAGWTKAITADEPVVDGDIFYDAQDWDIDNLRFVAENAGPATAVVRAEFDNLGEAKQIRFDLVAQDGAWKIANIRYREGYDLKGMLADPAPPPLSGPGPAPQPGR